MSFQMTKLTKKNPDAAFKTIEDIFELLILPTLIHHHHFCVVTYRLLTCLSSGMQLLKSTSSTRTGERRRRRITTSRSSIHTHRHLWIHADKVFLLVSHTHAHRVDIYFLPGMHAGSTGYTSSWTIPEQSNCTTTSPWIQTRESPLTSASCSPAGPTHPEVVYHTAASLKQQIQSFL